MINNQNNQNNQSSILLTAPPMINKIHNFKINCDIPYEYLNGQILTEKNAEKILSKYTTWIIGDDPCPSRLLKQFPNIKNIIKWGIGTDNIDIEYCKNNNIFFTNTPDMFGEEVSDVAIGYLIMLCRQLHTIDHEVRNGNWYKPCGITISGKNMAIIGYGNIGKCLEKKLKGFNVNINIFDPFIYPNKNIYECVKNADFIFITCSLNQSSYHLINIGLIENMKRGVHIINVSRGKIINENDLIEGMEIGIIAGAGLDVFEEEPFQTNSRLKNLNVILGSHNASNTIEGVNRVSQKVCDIVNEL